MAPHRSHSCNPSGSAESHPWANILTPHWPVKAATTRYFIVDASTGDVTQHAQSYQVYTDAQYRALLAECGFQDVEFLSSFGETEAEPHSDLITIVARKKPEST